ncbi:MAG: hypothetical protein PF569_06395 [Candidatus Woesearchaeota archaeon]|jgi:hypothetical protein|nr:hypothetical protein [Candidatus Woesearchaeota archaeon]
MKIKNLIFISLIISLIFISGCGSDIDCSLEDTTYKKYKFDEDTNECVIDKSIPQNSPTNGVIEDGETYCNAPEDVPKDHPDEDLGCDGNLGEYIDKVCNEQKECVFTQNEKVVENTISKELKNSDIVFDVRTNYNEPYILNTDDENNIELDITLFKFPQSSVNIKNIIVQEIKLEDSYSKLLGNIEYNEKISKIGDKLPTKKISLSDTTRYESSQSVKVKLIVTYTKETLDRDGKIIKTEDKIETLIESLPKITIINPNFYD